MGSITLSMIVKNEEKYLEGCLKSVENIADEIVIVDTGSTDSTIEIARRYNAKIYNFKWINDFAAARNFALEKSTGDWILYLDADERLNEKSISEFREAALLNKKYGIRCKVVSENSFKKNKQVFEYVRFFRNDPAIKFEGKVHEQIEPSLSKNNYEILTSAIQIDHLGYNIPDEELIIKAERNLILLMDEMKRNTSGYILFQIGQTYLVLGKKDEAIPYFRKSVEVPKFEIHHRAQAYRILAAYDLQNGKLDSAEENILSALKLSPNQVLNNLIAAKIYSYKNEHNLAVNYFKISLENNRKLSGGGNAFFDTEFDEKELLNTGLVIALRAENIQLYNQLYNEFLKDSENAVLNSQLHLFNSLINNLPLNESILDDLGEIVKQVNRELLLKFADKYLHRDKATLIAAIIENGIGEAEFCLKAINYFLDEDDIDNAEKTMDFMGARYSDNPKAILALTKYYSELGRIVKLNNVIDKALFTFKDYPKIRTILQSIKMKLAKPVERI